MTTALILLVAVIAMALLYLASLEGRYTVRRSLKINAEPKAVFDKLRDLKSWTFWSPWLMHEPEAKLAYSETPDQEGGWYSWDGRTIGAGKLTHARFTGETRIDQRLEFVRPFKSGCRVWWELEPADGGTLLHWNMAGCMPLLLRFMAKKMPEHIGKDFETGLHRLNATLDPDAETPHISFDGPVHLPDQSALTIHYQGHLDGLIRAMSEGFPRLGRYVEAHGLKTACYPFTVFHKVDLKKMHFNCDMAMPVPATTHSTEFVLKTCKGGHFYKTTLKGDYKFLELAWFQAYSHLHMQKIRPQRHRASMEVYRNDPRTVSHTNEIVTAIYIPI